MFSLPDQEIFSVIYEFSFLPALYVHNSWLQDLEFGQFILDFRVYPKVLPQISDYLLQQLAIDASYSIDFETGIRRIALIGQEDLCQFVLYLGLINLSLEVRKIIDGQTLRRVQEILGNDHFSFVRKQAMFFYPHVLKAIAPVSSLSIDALYHQVLYSGTCCLAFMFSKEPEWFINRLKLKLPKEYSECFKAFESATNEDVESLYKISKKLINYVVPQWSPLFV